MIHNMTIYLQQHFFRTLIPIFKNISYLSPLYDVTKCKQTKMQVQSMFLHHIFLLLHLKEWPAFCLIAFICLLTVCIYLKSNSRVIDHWFFLGNLPSLLWNSNRVNEWLTEVFISLKRGSFFINGPIFSKFCYLVTCDPKNIEYIFKTNFNNYTRGPDCKQVLDIIGDGIFNLDLDPWRLQRKVAHAAVSSLEFKNLLSKMSRKVVQDQLIPFLAHSAEQNSTIDLQDVFSRYSFEINMSVIFGRQEGYLSLDLPTNEFADADDIAQEAILNRFVMPMFLWKLLRWLGMQKERELAKAHKKVDSLVQEYISQKKKELRNGVETYDLLSSYIKLSEEKGSNALGSTDKFLRDSMLSFFIAGRDTTGSGLAWLFWLLSKNPSVETKILEELKQQLHFSNKDETPEKSEWPTVFNSNELKRLVYLHATLYESLRLYPPLPFLIRTIIKEDTLPDGTIVKPWMKVILPIYSVARMPWVWGEDCLEFKPERWIDDDGKLSHEHMSKFFIFSYGPRTCLGRETAFTQMKSVVAALLFNFSFQVVDGQDVCPNPCISLEMKNGLMVNVKKRLIKI